MVIVEDKLPDRLEENKDSFGRLPFKICGMKQLYNINEVSRIGPDYMGFIFYEKSPRNALNFLDTSTLLSFPPTIRKVGVFVDATIDFIAEIAGKYQLNYIQLHGHETPDFCARLSADNYKIIKAFSIDDHFDFSVLTAYEPYCEFFLFDTKGNNPGGNGKKFDWEILKTKIINKPFFLSGGIELDDLPAILDLASQVSTLYALDVNSKFEVSPGLKDPDKINELKRLLYANADRL